MATLSRFYLDASIYLSVGFAAVIPLLFLNTRFARALGLIDWPKARGLTDDHVPIVGPSLAVIALLTLGIISFYFPVSPWVVTPAVIIGVMGYYDDRRSLPALDKLFFQVVCASAAVFLDPQISTSLGSRFGVGGLLLGTLFVVTVMNAVNFIDGIDGLAGIVLLTAFGILPFTASAHHSAFPYVILSCVLAGALVPFLYLNVMRRGGFLGNVGSYFFSFLAAVAHLSVGFDSPSAFSRVSLSALCFLVPLSDLGAVLILRLSSGRSPFKPDKGHLHHRLVQSNLPLRYVLSVMGLIQFVGVGICSYLSQPGAVEFTSLPFVVFLGLSIICTTLIVLLEKASRIRVQNYFQRLDAGDPVYYLKYSVARKDLKPLSNFENQKLEAKFATEIRVTDICVVQNGTVFIVLRTLAEPLKGISHRLEAVIQSERSYDFHLVEKGDFTKRASRPGVPTRRTA